MLSDFLEGLPLTFLTLLYLYSSRRWMWVHDVSRLRPQAIIAVVFFTLLLIFDLY